MALILPYAAYVFKHINIKANQNLKPVCYSAIKQTQSYSAFARKFI